MNQNNFIQKYPEIQELNRRLDELIDHVLNEFNQRSVKLFDLPAHQRIFLFILTRALKTRSAIRALCQDGYGQDATMLLRFLLENLITARYILKDLPQADELTRRFVAYKWVILQRSVQEDERRMQKASEEEQKVFWEKKTMISKNVDDFKKKYSVESDRALLTWSGKTIKDMAKIIGMDWLKEYEQTFRLCSRFSHPSILGDREYMVMNDHRLVFSPLPSEIGVIVNLRKMSQYVLDYLRLVEQLFHLEKSDAIEELHAFHKIVFEKYAAQESSAARPKNDGSSIRDSIVAFDIG